MTTVRPIPLVLGFFLIGLLMVAGAVLASDAYTKQRDLQSICDGAAIAAANSVDTGAARTQTLAGALPLADVQQATDDYLARDPSRAEVQIDTSVSADGRTVHADCRRHTKSRLRLGHRPRPAASTNTPPRRPAQPSASSACTSHPERSRRTQSPAAALGWQR